MNRELICHMYDIDRHVMGRLGTQQRGENVCILKGCNAILQQAVYIPSSQARLSYEMNMNNDIAIWYLP